MIRVHQRLAGFPGAPRAIAWRPGAAARAWPESVGLSLVARYAIGLHYRYSLLVGFILAVIFAAVIVAAIDRRPSARR